MNPLAAAALAAGDLICEFNTEMVLVYQRAHAWHFDTGVYADPDAAFARLPSGAATGSCEPWRIE